MVHTRTIHDLFHMLPAADVARIQAQLVHAVLRRGDGQAVVKVDIRHKRDVDGAVDGGDRPCARLVEHGNAHDLAPGALKLQDLGDGRRRIARVRVRHGLDADGRAAADANAAGGYAACDVPLHAALPPPNFAQDLQYR